MSWNDVQTTETFKRPNVIAQVTCDVTVTKAWPRVTTNEKPAAWAKFLLDLHEDEGVGSWHRREPPWISSAFIKFYLLLAVQKENLVNPLQKGAACPNEWSDWLEIRGSGRVEGSLPDGILPKTAGEDAGSSRGFLWAWRRMEHPPRVKVIISFVLFTFVVV